MFEVQLSYSSELRTQKYIQHKTQRLSTNTSKCLNLQL